MSKLYQLPISGDWLQLQDVRALEIREKFDRHRECVILIDMYVGYGKQITCKTLEQAQAARDEIAAAVNEAREGVE